MAEFWCFNCQQRVGEEEVYNATRHKGFLGKQMAFVQSVRALSTDANVCICQDCVFYRVQICFCCNKAAPLCMFTLEEWFVDNSMHRKCLDCTALNETLHISSSLPYKAPTHQFVQQCLRCSKFKYICSFVILRHCYDENCCHRAIRDGNEKPCIKEDSSMYSVCLECKLHIDIKEYKLFLKERYHFRISLEPSISCSSAGNVVNSKKKSYSDAVIGGITKNSLVKNDNIMNQRIQKPFNGPVFVISSLKGVFSMYCGSCAHHRFKPMFL